MSDSYNAPMPGRKRGIVRPGQKHMHDVALVRVGDMGLLTVDADHAHPTVEGVTKTGADVKFAASGTRAHVLMAKLYGPDVADSVAQAAVEWAENRNSGRVWDIDLAAASGFEWTPEGAVAFRSSIGLEKAACTPWPSTPKTTPHADTPRGSVIDLNTGRVI